MRDAARLFGPARARIVLAAVADPDMVEFGDAARQQEWHELLAERAGWLPADGPAPVLEVLCGQPGRMLLEAAEAEQADALIIGRRGRGLSHRLLGSVAHSLARHASIPVLLAGAGQGGRATRGDSPRRSHRAPGSRPVRSSRRSRS